MYGELMGIAMGFAFAISLSITRKIEDQTTPFFNNAIRIIVGVITFNLGAIIANSWHFIFDLPIELWIYFCLSIFFNVLVGDTLYLYSQQKIGPTIASTISSFLPFISILMEIFILDRIINIWVVIAALLSVSGVIVIVFSEKRSEAQKRNQLPPTHPEIQPTKKKSEKTLVRGLIFAGVATICWAFGNIFMDLGLHDAEAILPIGSRLTFTVFTIRYNFALIILILFSINKYFFDKRKKKRSIQLLEEAEIHETIQIPVKKSKQIWGYAILAGIFAISLGTFFYGEASRTTSATVVSILNTIFPVFIFPINFIINKEKITLGSALGCLIVLIGVILLFII